MSYPYPPQPLQQPLPPQQQTFLDTLFNTHRIINLAILASSLGIIILLSLAYLLRNTTTVLHLAILAVLMLILCTVLIIYKGMIANDQYQKVNENQDKNDGVRVDSMIVIGDILKKKYQEDREIQSGSQQESQDSAYQVIDKSQGSNVLKQVVQHKQN